jgi:hypothetical protein
LPLPAHPPKEKVIVTSSQSLHAISVRVPPKHTALRLWRRWERRSPQIFNREQHLSLGSVSGTRKSHLIPPVPWSYFTFIARIGAHSLGVI